MTRAVPASPERCAQTQEQLAIIIFLHIRKLQLLDIQETREYCKPKEETVYSTVQSAQFGRGCEPIVKQATKMDKQKGPKYLKNSAKM